MRERCKFYRAMADNKTCGLGIDYGQVVAPAVGKPGANWPCFTDEVKTCPHAVYPTPDEVAARDSEIGDMLKRWIADLENDICPHCKTPIKNRQQVGRCVYAQPCGCRLYQGRLV